MKKLLFMVLILSTTGIALAQNKQQDGKKEGMWQHKDAQSQIYAEGNYQNDLRQGAWKFYLSPTARQTQVADVVGHYQSGIKQGAWVHTNPTTKIAVSATFENGLMHGECIYYNQEKTVLARGLVEDGIRHGKWILYDKESKLEGYYKNELKLRQKMSEGFYKDGIRTGNWVYDYYPNKYTHVKGSLSFENGVNNGKFEFYKIEKHEKFGATESLAGVGTYTNGKKSGRWIEFKQGTTGDYIESGDYDSNGERDGLWKILIGQELLMSSNYKNGKLQGKFEHYYENGNLMCRSNYENGYQVGAFKNYYKNGKVKEEGIYTLVDLVQKDTMYLTMKLPQEHAFILVDEDFETMNYNYIQWLKEPAWSIAPSELNRRLNIYRTYGKESVQRIAKITTKSKQSVRVGNYLAFYENGSLRLKGENIAGRVNLFNPLKSKLEMEYNRIGKWKEYDEKGLLKYTYIYANNKLEEMLDANGYIVHKFQYEQNKLVGMTDGTGNDISINLKD